MWLTFTPKLLTTTRLLSVARGQCDFTTDALARPSDQNDLPVQTLTHTVFTHFTFKRKPNSRALEDRSQPLTATDAHRLEAVPSATAFKLMEHRGQDPATGGSDGMT